MFDIKSGQEEVFDAVSREVIDKLVVLLILSAVQSLSLSLCEAAVWRGTTGPSLPMDR